MTAAPHAALQESLKFMRHAKREVLTTDDVNAALRLRNVEALYGFTANSDPLNFVRAVGTNDLYFIDDKARPVHSWSTASFSRPLNQTRYLYHVL